MDSNRSMGMLYFLSDWIIRLLMVNLLWLIFNLPVVFFLIHLLIVKNTEGFIAIGLIILVMTPFLFFPATTSMFAVVRRWVMKETNSSVIHVYWKAYKENYIKSMLGGIVIGIVWLIVTVDYYVFTSYMSPAFKYLFIIIFIFLLVYTVHFFSAIVHFETTFFNAMKNALFITIGRPFLSIGLAVVNIIILYISFNYVTFIIPLFTGSLLTLIFFSGFYKVYLTIQQ